MLRRRRKKCCPHNLAVAFMWTSSRMKNISKPIPAKLARNETLIRYHRLDDATVRSGSNGKLLWIYCISTMFAPSSWMCVFEIVYINVYECYSSFLPFRMRCVLCDLLIKANHHKKREMRNAYRTHDESTSRSARPRNKAHEHLYTKVCAMSTQHSHTHTHRFGWCHQEWNISIFFWLVSVSLC